MATLTKTEKEFWAQELRHIIDDEIEKWSEVIAECTILAEKKVLEDLGVEKDWKKINSEWASLEKDLAKFEDRIDAINDGVKELNKVVRRKIEKENVDYNGQVYYTWEDVSISFNSPSLGSGRYNPLGFDEKWLKKIAVADYLNDVLAEEGHDQVLALYQARKTVKRNVFLATTTQQMQEFITRFCETLGLEL